MANKKVTGFKRTTKSAYAQIVNPDADKVFFLQNGDTNESDKGYLVVNGKKYGNGIKSATYSSVTNKITFENIDGTTNASEIDCSSFLVDEMVEDVKLITIVPFNSDTAYSAGDYVFRASDGKVYKFKVNHAAGAWNAEEVDEVPGVAAAGTYLLIDFNTASGKNDVWIDVKNLFDPTNYYTKSEIDSGFKPIQTRVDDPANSGQTSIEFISNIEQAVDGKITPTKKTVAQVQPSTSGTGGSNGLMTATQAEKLNALPTNSELNTALGEAEALIASEVLRAGNAETALSNRITPLEAAVGQGGSIDNRISGAINELDATASQTAANTNGHLSLSVTEENGKITGITGSIDDAAYIESGEGSAVIADFDPQTDTVWKKAQVLSSAEKAQIQQNIGVREWLNNLTGEKFASVSATDQTSDITDLLPATGETDTVYRVGMWDGTQYNEEYYSDYAWDGTAYVQLNKKSIVGEVFDISEYNAGAAYADLAAALGVDGANVPLSVRKGGMSVKFVLNSDNKYVQYRLMATSFSTTESDWENIDAKLAQKADLVEIVTSRNLFNKDNLVNGYINLTGGMSAMTNPAYKCCAPIPIVAGEVYVLTYPTDVGNKGLRFLDADGNQLHALTYAGNEWDYIISVSQPVVKAPETAVSFQFQVKFNDNVDLDTAQFEKGVTPTSHVPYTSKMVLDEQELPDIIGEMPSQIEQLEEDVDSIDGDIDNLEENKANLEVVVFSRNLFNKDDLVNGYISATNGSIGQPTNPSYKVSGKIPIVEGTVYYVTFPTGVGNKGWRFTDDEDNPIMPLNPSTGLSYNSWVAASNAAIKAPTGAKYFQFQIKFNDITDPDTAQFELGATPTAHVPYQARKVIKEDEMPESYYKLETQVSELINKKNEGSINFDSNADSYIISDFNSTNKIKLTFWLNENTRNDVFNFRDIYLINKLTGIETNVKTARDDVAPPFFQPGPDHLGGNHGANILQKLTVSSHDKEVEDIGSVWSNGTNQFILVKVESGYLYFIGQNTLEYPSFSFPTLSASGTLTSVSGATHTTDITYTARANEQWWPFYKTRSVKSVFIDGEKVEQGGIYAFDVMKVSEDYDILNPASVLAKIQDGVGTFTQNPTPQDFANTADLLLHISHVFIFNSAAECMVAENLCIYQNINNFSHHGFTQSATLLGDNKKIYIPKAKSKGNGATAVNFRTIADISDAVGLIKYNDWEVPTLPPDRILVFDDNIGLQVGYLFDYGVGGSNRAAAIPANTAIEISDTYKLYPYGWNIANTTLPSYSNKSAVCFRNFIDRSKINTNGIISTCVFEYNEHCYIYADFNAAGDYEIEIPTKYQGGQIETLEKRDNVLLLTQNASEKVFIHVSTDDIMYGYFVGKI